MEMGSESEKIESASSSACSNVIEEDTSTYPDGGWRAWGVVLGAWCAMMPCYGLLNSTGVLQTWLENHQLKSYSPSTIGWIFSLYNFFFYLGSAQVGKCLMLLNRCSCHVDFTKDPSSTRMDSRRFWFRGVLASWVR